MQGAVTAVPSLPQGIGSKPDQVADLGRKESHVPYKLGASTWCRPQLPQDDTYFAVFHLCSARRRDAHGRFQIMSRSKFCKNKSSQR